MTVDQLIELLEQCDGTLPVRVAVVADGVEHDLDEGVSVFGGDQVLIYQQGYAERWRTTVTTFTTREELETRDER